MSEITVETGELPVCVNCQLKHAVGLLHHVDPSLETQKYNKTIQLVKEIGEGLMMTSQEVEDFIRAYELEHKVEDVLTVLRDLRHNIMEGSEERFEALEAGGNPGNPKRLVRTGLLTGRYIEAPKMRYVIKTEKVGDVFFETEEEAERWKELTERNIPGVKFEIIELENPSNPGIPEYCEFKKEPVKPKEYFDRDSFRTICPECPESRCALCPPELSCATRIITGCKEGYYIKGRCQVGTEAHVIYHG